MKLRKGYVFHLKRLVLRPFVPVEAIDCCRATSNLGLDEGEVRSAAFSTTSSVSSHRCLPMISQLGRWEVVAAVCRGSVTVAFFAHRRKRPQNCFTLVFTLCKEFGAVFVEGTEEKCLGAG